MYRHHRRGRVFGRRRNLDQVGRAHVRGSHWQPRARHGHRPSGRVHQYRRGRSPAHRGRGDGRRRAAAGRGRGGRRRQPGRAWARPTWCSRRSPRRSGTSPCSSPNETSTVGPVTSTRPTDGQALSVLHPLIGYNGGTAGFISVLDATKVIDAGYASHAPLYSPGSSGLTVSTAALAAASRSDGPPPSLFTYRLPGGPLASTRETHPTSVRVDIPGQPEQRWTFDARADRWVQTAGGPRVSVANLVVQIVPFKTIYLSHRYGLTTQSARVIGRGQATVFSGQGTGRRRGQRGLGRPGSSPAWPPSPTISTAPACCWTSRRDRPGSCWPPRAPGSARPGVDAVTLTTPHAHDRSDARAGEHRQAPQQAARQPQEAVVRQPSCLERDRPAGGLSALVGPRTCRRVGHHPGRPDGAADAVVAPRRQADQGSSGLRAVAALPGLHGRRGAYPRPGGAGHRGQPDVQPSPGLRDPRPDLRDPDRDPAVRREPHRR